MTHYSELVLNPDLKLEMEIKRIPSDTVRSIFSNTSALVAAFMVFSPFLISDPGLNPPNMI